MIVAGFGFRNNACPESLANAYAQAGGGKPADIVATPDGKHSAESMVAFAAAVNLPVVGISQERLATQTTLTSSQNAQAAYGTGSVAEAAALSAAGPNARLLAPRAVSDDRMATCAFAIGEET